MADNNLAVKTNEVNESIKKIKEKRSKRLEDINRKFQALDDIESGLDEMISLRNEMITPSGEVIPGSRFTQIINSNPEMAMKLSLLDPEGIKEMLAEARERLEEYKNRCKRETVNIAVVGKARIGKSALLNTITGLGGKHVIPESDQTDCTGAPSIIYNKADVGMSALVTFKTSRQMMSLAQKYIDELVDEAPERPIIRRLSDIKDLKIYDGKTYESMSNADKAASINALIPKGSANGTLVDKLVRLKNSYDEWLKFIDNPPKELTSERDIIKYVAQYEELDNGEKKEYNMFFAVATCEITYSFPNSGMGDICLIDTVGLGDTGAVGLTENMLGVIKEKSDAVIFLITPKDGSGYGIEETVKRAYEQIAESCGSRNLDKWLFYRINKVENPPEGGTIPRNTLWVEGAREKIKYDPSWYGRESAKIIDVKNYDEVIDDFVELLDSVLINLDSIDKYYRDPAAEALDRVEKAFRRLSIDSQKILQADLRNNAMIPLLMDAKLREMSSELMRYANEWRGKSKQPCRVVDECATRIFGRMTDEYAEGSYFPHLEEIVKRLETGGIGNRPNEVYTSYADFIRVRISEEFLGLDVELDDEIKAMKRDLARVLMDKCGYSAIYPAPEEEGTEDEWLEEFAENVLGADENYKGIKDAFEIISSFKFSVKNFLTYEIREQLDRLDPGLINLPAVINNAVINNAVNTDRRTAINIFTHLNMEVANIKASLQSMIRDLAIKPNKAMYAAVMDFYDKVTYGDGAKAAWYRIYADNAAVLWAKEINAQQQVSILCEEWMQTVTKLQKLNVSNNFRLKEIKESTDELD